MDRLQEGLKALDVEISAATAQKEVEFLDEMLRWNKQVNLTSIRDRQTAIEKHLIDSLALLPCLSQGSLLDMGSGGGLPGIPLAIALPDLLVTSVDSVGKKINFQKHIKRKLQLQNLQPINSRLEDLNRLLDDRSRFDYVVARAFAAFDLITRFATPWLAENGKLLVMKGPEGHQELAENRENLEKYGYEIEGSSEYRLPYSGAVRQLIVLKRRAESR